MVECGHCLALRAYRVACVISLVCLTLGSQAAAGERGTQSLPPIIPLVSPAAERASNDSIALLNDLAATVRSTAQSGLQTLANAPAQFVEAFGRAQALVSNQFAATPLEAEIQHPFPAYPDTLFTWSVCNTSNPYLVVSVRDQEVPIINVGQPVNESVMAFAISTWAEIAYHDPSLRKYYFKIAEDLIYDIANETISVATPFDVKNGRGQVPGVTAVGHTSNNSSAGADSSSDIYHIKFTFAASPLASQASAQPEGALSPAANVSEPTAGVSRLTSGQISDKDITGRATGAFTELVARMYFNIVTAALGNSCNPGSPQLVPVASCMLNRLRALSSSNETTYNGLPLNETLIDDGSGQLCMQEANALYNGENMALLNTTTAATAAACCAACRASQAQASDGMACNAWLFCGEPGGCHNSTMSFGASQHTCSLYYASDLEYNTPLDKNVGVLRGANVTFTSGRTAAVIPDNIMSILVPARDAVPGNTIGSTPTFQSEHV